MKHRLLIELILCLWISITLKAEDISHINEGGKYCVKN